MAQKQIDDYRKRIGITSYVSEGKTITVKEDMIKLKIDYGKCVPRNYTIVFSHEEWKTLQRKINESCEVLKL